MRRPNAELQQCYYYLCIYIFRKFKYCSQVQFRPYLQSTFSTARLLASIHLLSRFVLGCVTWKSARKLAVSGTAVLLLVLQLLLLLISSMLDSPSSVFVALPEMTKLQARPGFDFFNKMFVEGVLHSQAELLTTVKHEVLMKSSPGTVLFDDEIAFVFDKRFQSERFSFFDAIFKHILRYLGDFVSSRT